MEIEKPAKPDAPIAMPENTLQLPETTDLLTERRIAKSSKKSPEPLGEDIDEDVGDADEAAVEATAEETLVRIDGLLTHPKAPKAISEFVQPSGKIDKKDAKEFVDTVNEHDVTDIEVQGAVVGEKTTVTASNGRKRVVVLDEDEKSRAVRVGGETVLVIDSDLNKQEVIDETEKQVISRIEFLLASDYGLDERYDPVFNILNTEGFGSLATYMGSYAFPKANSRNNRKIFEKNDQADRVFDLMLMERQSYDRLGKK